MPPPHTHTEGHRVVHAAEAEHTPHQLIEDRHDQRDNATAVSIAVDSSQPELPDDEPLVTKIEIHKHKTKKSKKHHKEAVIEDQPDELPGQDM